MHSLPHVIIKHFFQQVTSTLSKLWKNLVTILTFPNIFQYFHFKDALIPENWRSFATNSTLSNAKILLSDKRLYDS